MSRTKAVHSLVTIAINLSVVCLLIHRAWTGNDKAIILVIFFYPLLILINAVIWLTLSSVRNEASGIYRRTTIGLIILFIPVLLIAAMY